MYLTSASYESTRKFANWGFILLKKPGSEKPVEEHLFLEMDWLVYSQLYTLLHLTKRFSRQERALAESNKNIRLFFPETQKRRRKNKNKKKRIAVTNYCVVRILSYRYNHHLYFIFVPSFYVPCREFLLTWIIWYMPNGPLDFVPIMLSLYPPPPKKRKTSKAAPSKRWCVWLGGSSQVRVRNVVYIYIYI